MENPSWARLGKAGEPSPILELLKRHGYREGHDYRWVQKSLSTGHEDWEEPGGYAE